MALLAAASTAAIADGSGERHTVNEGCTTPAANEVRCEIKKGRSQYRIYSNTSQYLRLVNRSTATFEVERVTGTEPKPDVPFREYCVSLGDFATSQATAGRGEVACRTKHDGKGVPPIVFGRERGLSVVPGESLYISSSPADSEPWFDVEVTVKEGDGGSLSWRLPHQDRSIKCDGSLEETDFDTWRNDTGRPLRMQGALIYAESGIPSDITKVGKACVSVIDASGHPRSATCSGFDSAGPIDLDQTIEPSERIVAYASNTCRPGGVWDWAIYLFVSP